MLKLPNTNTFQEVLTFWFDEFDPEMWWTQNSEIDEQIKFRFLPLLKDAAQGALYEWRAHPKGRLAEIIVLDQFSRNIYRNTTRAFSQDPMALVLAQEAIAAGTHIEFSPTERCFLFLPYMHSECMEIHVVAETLYKEYGSVGNHQFELRHKDIISRFGRYPHRNQVLGRTSTPEEIEFLKQPGSSF